MIGTPLQFDTLLHLCQDQHRRIVVATLACENRSLTVNDLTKAIIKYNHHVPVMEASADDTKEIRLSLHHTHIPKLADRSLVEYDRDRRLVKPTSKFDQLEPQLSAIVDADPALEPPVTL